MLLLCCTLSLSCGSRSLTEDDVIGTYVATADWGGSTLVLHADHTFEQRVNRNDHTQATVKGTWRLIFYDGKNASHALLDFRPVFLNVAHDEEGKLGDGASPSVTRGFLWGIIIAADPDWGISFEKE